MVVVRVAVAGRAVRSVTRDFRLLQCFWGLSGTAGDPRRPTRIRQRHAMHNDFKASPKQLWVFWRRLVGLFLSNERVSGEVSELYFGKHERPFGFSLDIIAKTFFGLPERGTYPHLLGPGE